MADSAEPVDSMIRKDKPPKQEQTRSRSARCREGKRGQGKNPPNLTRGPRPSSTYVYATAGKKTTRYDLVDGRSGECSELREQRILTGKANSQHVNLAQKRRRGQKMILHNPRGNEDRRAPSLPIRASKGREQKLGRRPQKEEPNKPCEGKGREKNSRGLGLGRKRGGEEQMTCLIE